jgi:hypothetical protein
MKAILAGALLALATTTAIAMEDPLMQAVGFALTGSDNTKVQIIDRKNCVFRIGSYDVFHLNNVQVNRLVIEKSFGMFVTSSCTEMRLSMSKRAICSRTLDSPSPQVCLIMAYLTSAPLIS